MLIELLIKFFVGGGTLVAVSLLVQKGLPQYAGILMTVPVITIISFLYTPEQQLVHLGKYGVAGLVLAIFFIFACLLLYQHGVSRLFSVVIAFLFWVMTAAAYILLCVQK